MTPSRQSALVGTPALKWTRLRAVVVLVFVLCMGMWGCDGDGGTYPPNLRFGQVGEVEVELAVPLPGSLRLDVGSLHQTLTWSSTGAWSLRESIEYRGLIGDETVRHNQGDPSPLAAPYASWVTLVNDVDGQEGLRLDPEEVSQDTVPDECGPTRTRITLTIRDEARGEQRRWIRCADGSLSNLTPVGAGPDPAAARVVSAAMIARDKTVDAAFISAYHGSVPFGTLARVDDTNAPLTAPFYVQDAEAWQAFWQSHGGGGPTPHVDFENEIVVVAAVGVREEAGDSVEVRRILQVDDGTLTFVFNRLPGDFCSPAARSHVPFHAVVAPRTPAPFRFADIAEELVSCGG